MEAADGGEKGEAPAADVDTVASSSVVTVAATGVKSASTNAGRAPDPQPSKPEYDTSQGMTLIGVGLGGLAVLGGLIFYGRKFMAVQMPEMKKVRC
jgi:hypothetical protein